MMRRDTLLIRNKTSYGFTLVEVLVVLSITAIIVGAATPSFMNIVANNRVASASSELVIALNLAKSEAVRSGMTTVLCTSQTANQCNDAANWSDGLILFQDNDNNGSVSNNERVIKVIPASDNSLEFAYIVDSTNKINFRANGQINLNGHFCFKNSYEEKNSRAVIITQSGRIRAEKQPYDC